MSETEHFQTSQMPPRLKPGEKTQRIQIIAPESWVQEVEEWRREQPGRIPGISKAIRVLVEAGLKATRKGGRK